MLREAFFGEVDESFLALLDVYQLLLERSMEFPQRRLLVRHGCVDVVHDAGHEVFGQVQGAVVPHDVVLDQFGGQVRQIALAATAAHAEEVGVLVALGVRHGEDERVASSGLLATLAVEQLLEVVEVRPVASGRRGALLEDLLYDGKQFWADDRLVTSGVQLGLVAHQSHVVRIG
nr:hypothetical protein [Nocardioides sp. TRM66260-LWL]